MAADFSLVSIIMPVYQIPEKLLRHSIESVLNQTYKKIELILVDDGSDDDSGKICDEYAYMDHRVTCCHTANQGVSGARNYGLERAQGDYITFVDSDDSLDPCIIQQMTRVCIEEKADCVICSCRHLHKNSMEEKTNNLKFPVNKKVYSRERILHELFYMGKPYEEMEITAVWGKLYSKKIIKDIFFDTDMSIGEDFVFNYNFLKNALTVVCIDTKGYNYLLRPESTMHGKYKPKHIRSLEGFKKLLLNCNEEDRLGVTTRAVNTAIVIFLMIPEKKCNAEDEKLVIDFIRPYRKEVLFNPNARFKVKISLLLSYVGFGFMKRVYKVFFR